MSNRLVKFFTKKKNSSKENKENDASLKRVNFERASTRSEAAADSQQRERDRQAMRAIPNPYSVWTEPKKTRGPSSCPGVALDSTYFNERRSVRPPKQERAGSVYGGDLSGHRQYRIDGPLDLNHSHHSSSHSHHGGHRSSRRYGDLSMIEERSERSDRSMHQHPQEWNRSSSSHRRPPANQSYVDYTSGESEDEEDGYVRRLQHQIHTLKEDKSRYRNLLDNKKSDLEYTNYKLRETERALKHALDNGNRMESELSKAQRRINRLEQQLQQERKQAEILSLRLSEMSTSATSNGAMERLVSSSETSLEMDGEEGEESAGGDEVRNFRASDSVVTASTAAAEEAAAATAADTAAPSEIEEMELPRTSQTPSPEFELRRSFSDMGPVSMVDGAGEEMAEGGSWRRRDKRRSFVKRSLLPPPQESESSDGEKISLMERQVKKRGAVVKYDPSRRVPVKEKHFRRFSKHERSALDRFGFLNEEITDISGMLSSPNDGNY